MAVVVCKSCIDVFVDWQPDLSRPGLFCVRWVGGGRPYSLAAAATTAGDEGTTNNGGRPVETTMNVAHATTDAEADADTQRSTIVRDAGRWLSLDPRSKIQDW